MSLATQRCSCESRSPARRLHWAPAFAGALLRLSAGASGQAPARAPTVPPACNGSTARAKAAASSIQAYHAFRDYVLAAARRRPRDSVVLAPGATLEAPRFLPCGRRPLAVVLDVDETALQNLGYEYDEALRGQRYDQERWNRWERTGANAVLPMPGAVDRAARRSAAPASP